ncbi:Crossover junction endonuclease mus81 [Ancistrocladus abbreviatus]
MEDEAIDGLHDIGEFTCHPRLGGTAVVRRWSWNGDLYMFFYKKGVEGTYSATLEFAYLQRSGLKKLIYVVEVKPNQADLQENEQGLRIEGKEGQEEGTEQVAWLILFRKYGYLTQAISKYYKSQLPEDKFENTHVCPPFNEFIKRCEDLDKMTVSDVFAIQFMQVLWVTEEVAIAVLDLYPTLLSLTDAYSHLEKGQLSIARAIDEDIILSQTINGYDQNLWHLSGNQDDSKVKPGGEDFEAKNEILNMDSKIKDDATIVAENAINESLVDKKERDLFHLIDHNYLPKMQKFDSYQDPIGGSEEGEQSSDHRLESLHNKHKDLPMDEIVIKESSITGKETQMVGTESQMEKKRVDDTKLLTFMRSSMSTVELVDLEDNEA